MNEAIENVCVREEVNDILPVPVCVPGDFTVRIGDVMPAYVLEGLEEEFAKFGGVAEAASGTIPRLHSLAKLCQASASANGMP